MYRNDLVNEDTAALNILLEIPLTNDLRRTTIACVFSLARIFFNLGLALNGHVHWLLFHV